MEYTVNEEPKILMDIINRHMDIDLRDRCRKRPHVDARRIYCRILRDRGYRLSKISKYINRDHTNVIHLLKNWDTIISTDELLSRRYTYIEKTLEEMLGYNVETDEDMIDYLINQKLTEHVEELTEKLAKLTEQNKELRRDISISQTTAISKRRFDRIFRLIEERMKVGTEDDVYIRINRMFNGYGIIA